MRAFIAIEPPAGVRDALVNLSNQLRADPAFSASWVPRDNLHLTLRFLGEVAPDTMERVAEGIEQACRDSAPANLGFERLGVFPSERRARVLWCGVRTDLNWIESLQSACEAAAVKAGLPPEMKRWTPHLTIARFRRTPPERHLQSVLAAFRNFAADEFLVTCVTLFSSALSPGGAVHTPFRKFSLECPSTSSSEPFTTS